MATYNRSILTSTHTIGGNGGDKFFICAKASRLAQQLTFWRMPNGRQSLTKIKVEFTDSSMQEVGKQQGNLGTLNFDFSKGDKVKSLSIFWNRVETKIRRVKMQTTSGQFDFNIDIGSRYLIVTGVKAKGEIHKLAILLRAKGVTIKTTDVPYDP